MPEKIVSSLASLPPPPLNFCFVVLLFSPCLLGNLSPRLCRRMIFWGVSCSGVMGRRAAPQQCSGLSSAATPTHFDSSSFRSSLPRPPCPRVQSKGATRAARSRSRLWRGVQIGCPLLTRALTDSIYPSTRAKMSFEINLLGALITLRWPDSGSPRAQAPFVLKQGHFLWICLSSLQQVYLHRGGL